MSYQDASISEINDAMEQSNKAFAFYKSLDLRKRAQFLYSVAEEMEATDKILLSTAREETHLDEGRLKVELKRTLFQLRSYADACAEGTWLDIRIDTADTQRTPPKPDLRKMLVPLGPVVVFGASNFPFAYSTAGGDTACALAAGCSVVVKAHPAHAHTSELVAEAVRRAAATHNLPEGVFIHLQGVGFEVGRALVQHPHTKAVGFTGSYEGGKDLFDLANQRTVPIPVFAEMGSVNPVFILPGKLAKDTSAIAVMYASSITQSAGQFCTNPGVLVAVESEALETFKNLLAKEISRVQPAKMLHPGIAKSYRQKRRSAIEAGAFVLAENDEGANGDESIPTLAAVAAESFIESPVLHKEVFGPYSLLVECANQDQLLEVARVLEGQLTCTLMALEEEVAPFQGLVDVLKEACGRFIFNGVPTGVEVALGMHHGGPFPATTDSRFTAVGADGIKRFARPLCFQGWKNIHLPKELKDENPLGLWRTVNNVLTRDAIPAN